MHQLLELNAFQVPVVWGFGVSFTMCVVLVLTQSWHGKLTSDSIEGIQKFHTAATPRVGGVPIFVGLIVAWINSPEGVKDLLTPIFFAGLPAFLTGTLEDLTKKIGVAERLIATMLSGSIACWLTGYSITRIDVIGIDALLQITFASILFTSFALAGVANSINIIDGFNGLASTTTVLAFIGYALIAHIEGDSNLSLVAFIMAACVWGFFWVNWPLGKIFLGDGGSYFIGFSLAWVAVLLLERNPSVSAFAVLIVCVHPVTEVLFSIYRRRIKKMHPGMPDRLHFHTLFKRRYVARWFAGFPQVIRNSLTGLLIGLMTLPAIFIAAKVYLSTFISVFCCLVLFLGYLALYTRMLYHSWEGVLKAVTCKCRFDIRS